MSDKKGKHYSVRLHPSDAREAEAIEIIEQLLAAGFSFREIVTDAVLRSAGAKPEMFRDRDGRSGVTMQGLENLLTDFAKDIIKQIQSLPVGTTQDTKRKPFGNDDDEEDIQYAQSLARGFAARRNRS